MTSASLENKTVHELQELARRAPLQPAKRRPAPLSRAARLHLIDLLSRWSAPGLALVAGLSVYLAIVAGRTYSGRAFAWGLMMLGALWVARRLRTQFRSGANFADRPLRWRAAYTASLTVLGVTLACAPILLAPAIAAPPLTMQIIALTLTIGFAAALFHAAHLFSAWALAIPAAAFAVLSGLRAGDPAIAAGAASAALIGFAGLHIANRYLEKGASRRYPRTTLLRREIERSTEQGNDQLADGSQALQA